MDSSILKRSVSRFCSISGKSIRLSAGGEFGDDVPAIRNDPFGAFDLIVLLDVPGDSHVIAQTKTVDAQLCAVDVNADFYGAAAVDRGCGADGGDFEFEFGFRGLCLRG